MGADSKIQWTHHTFNPWIGCAKVSEGCKFCYAEAEQDHRYHRAKWGVNGTRHITSQRYWKQPLEWDRDALRIGERHRVFCASLADVFEDRADLIVPRRSLAQLINRCQGLDWLFVTKRIELAASMIYEMWFEDAEWPRNYWLLTSVENQAAADARIPYLLRTQATIRGLSMEPLLGPVDISKWLVRRWRCPRCRYVAIARDGWHMNPRQGYAVCPTCWAQGFDIIPEDSKGIDWVIIGGESGPNARPCDLAWIRSIVAQCKTAGVPVFVKQLGAKVSSELRDENNPAYRGLMITSYGDPKGGNPDEWPEDLRVREFPSPAKGGA